MDALKPCPFCGGAAVCRSRPVSFYCEGRAYRVYCGFCRIGTIEMGIEEEVVKLWNRRTESEDNTK